MNMNKTVILVLILISVVVIGVLDYFTGTKVSFLLFYLFPAIAATWFGGRRWGIFTALFCGIISITADIVMRHGFDSGEYFLYWNIATRVGTSFLIVFLLSAVQAREASLRRNQAELQRKSDELARSNRELEQFASMAAHDLQEPLRKIITFGERIDAQNRPNFTNEEKEYILKMRHAANRMRKLIDDLLALARIGNQPTQFQKVDLNEIIGDVIKDLDLRIIQSGGHVETGSFPVIQADPVQMRQLFQNLVSNALKFKKPNEPPHVKISSRVADENLLEIQVKDNGIGFDEKYLSRVFKPFERLHGKAQYEGTGLGIPICQKIAQRHGGELKAKSSPGRGATFIVKLPIGN